MSGDVENAIAALVIAGGFVWLLCSVVKGDDMPNGLADSYNDWRNRHYRIENGRYYSIFPPNRFDSKLEQRKKYDSYCRRKNGRCCNG